jgi:parallel beta-helix repeat protein
MNKFYFYSIFSLFILLLITNILIFGALSVNSIHTNQKPTSYYIYVDGKNKNGPWDGSKENPYQTIQEGINHAKNGDTIIINSGVYKENPVVNKTITLKGNQKNTIYIDGNYLPYILYIQENNVSIQDISFQNSGGNLYDSGILIESSNNSIINCQFYRTKTGIRVNNQLNTTIYQCRFYTNGEGIYLSESNDSIINNCSFFHNGFGIYISRMKNIIISNCNAHTNGIGFIIEKSSNFTIEKCAAFNNNDNQGGFFLETCYEGLIYNCIIFHNGFGIKTSNCQNIEIDHSTISYNTHAGILTTDQSNNIAIKNCEITKNLRISIYNSESNITFQKNNIYSSICGVYTEDAICNAEYNWWGSIFGPSLFEKNQQDNIKQIQSHIDFIPWSYKKINLNGASWNLPNAYNQTQINNSYYMNYSFKGIDNDYDGIPDLWEQKYGYNPNKPDKHNQLDPDDDGLSNIEECFTEQWDSNPFHKDIFLEFDWMESKTSKTESNKPNIEFIQKAIEIFAKNNITLHIDVGQLNGGEQIPYASNFSFADLRDYYWNYFLHNDLNNPRKGIFHYGLICDYGPASGFAFIGWDSLDSFCISADILKNQYEISYPRQRFIMGSSIHELGHTLGLTVDDHGGIDNKISTMLFSIQWLKYLNYRSCLNYFYTYLILGFSNGENGPGDFNDWEHLDFSFFKNTHFILSNISC